MPFPCAILCHSVFQSTTRALLFALVATGCGGATATDGVAGVGGAPGAAGTGGSRPSDGTSHEGGTAGAAGAAVSGGIGGGTGGIGGGTGGTGGAAPTTDCNAHGTYPNCGTCTMTLQEYCGTTNPCQLVAASVCTQFAFGSNWKRGCGYIRVDYWGDVSDQFTDIWDEVSGQLVYHWFNGMMSSGCVPDTHAGTVPACDQWIDACGSTGGTGGTSGSGGSATIIQTGGAAPTGGNSAVGSGGSPVHTGGANPAGGSPGIWTCLCNCVCASCTSSSSGRCPGPGACDTCTPTCTQYCSTTTGCGAFVSKSEQICGPLY